MRSRIGLSLVVLALGAVGAVALAQPPMQPQAPPLTPPPVLPPIPWPLTYPLSPAAPAPRMQPISPMAPFGPHLPYGGFPPLFYARFVGPAGAKLTIVREEPEPRKLDLPALVGFRPGYSYRIAVSDLPGRPGAIFHSTIEVRGSMLLSPKLRNADFPATIVFREDELDKLIQGTMLRKMIVLEKPDTAVPTASNPDEPVELPMHWDRDPMAQAVEHGLPLAVLYMGPRRYEIEEMRAAAGTIYLPGDRTFGPPMAPPMLPASCYSLIDPIAKMAHPAEWTTVYDGGDIDVRAGFDKSGRLVGVDPSDTVAVYVNVKGQRKIVCSNRVALCIPRFILLRSDTTPDVSATVRPPIAAVAVKSPQESDSLLRPITYRQKTQLELAAERRRLTSSTNIYGTAVQGTVKGLEIKATIRAAQVVDGLKMAKSEEEVPLIIIKWPDRHGVLPGELLMWTLRFTNPGKQPINDVTVVDNLTPRFEYMPGTSKTDRDGTFTFRPNEAGSSYLQWDFTEPLQPGESGMITFQVKVR
jgi:uncharacterized repeat protein (TIGR01451 family)